MQPQIAGGPGQDLRLHDRLGFFCFGGNLPKIFFTAA